MITGAHKESGLSKSGFSVELRQYLETLKIANLALLQTSDWGLETGNW